MQQHASNSSAQALQLLNADVPDLTHFPRRNSEVTFNFSKELCSFLPLHSTQQSNTPHHVACCHGSYESSCWDTKDWQKVAFSPSTHPDRVRFFSPCMTSLIWIFFSCWLNSWTRKKRDGKEKEQVEEYRVSQSINEQNNYVHFKLPLKCPNSNPPPFLLSTG